METVKIEPAGVKEVEVTLGRFRLTNGLRLSSVSPVGCEYIPATEELALEAKGKENYYVIAFIEYDSKEETCDMRTVGPRFHEEVDSDKDWHDVKALIQIAYEIILAANNIED